MEKKEEKKRVIYKTNDFNEKHPKLTTNIYLHMTSFFIRHKHYKLARSCV